MARYTTGSLTTPDGAAIRYIDIGSGSPVVYIPGSQDDMLERPAWWLVSEFRRYVKHHRLVIILRRTPVPADLTQREVAGDYAWAIEQLRLMPAHVECSSYGGTVAQWLAVDRPDLVRSLVLGETMARVDEPLRAVVRQWFAWAETNSWRELLYDAMTRSLTPRTWRLARLAFPLLLRLVKPGDLRRFLHLSAGMLELDQRPLLGRISCPTLVIGGDADQLARPELQREMAALIPGARLVLLPGQGHAAHVEAAAYQRETLAFFADVERVDTRP